MGAKLSDALLGRIDIIEQYLNGLIKDENIVCRAMKYSISAGGKRIRPLITVLACEAMGGKSADAMPFAAAIEMVHTYSLIHDDLPAMDNDDLRRGQPTCHKKFGEATAILAGDGLLTLAFDVISNSELSNKQKVMATGALARAAGPSGMVLGQALDMQGQSSLNELVTMYERKTGDLLAVSAALGSIAAGGTGKEFDKYCRAIGIVFQIKDDILDVFGNEKLLGKPVNSDKCNGKTTVLSFIKPADAENLINDYTKEAIESIKFLGDKGNLLRELAVFLTQREV